MTMGVRLVVPHDVDRPTGGNIYDLSLAQALTRLGVAVEVVPTRVEELESALVCADSGGDEREFAPTRVLVDGLLACARPEALPEPPQASGGVSGGAPVGPAVGVLVHMPLAWADPGAEAAERRALRSAEFVVATSQWTADFLLRTHDLGEVLVVRPGVEPADVEVGSTPPLLAQVATLAPHKDQLAVVEAMAQVADLPWRLRLAGAVDAEPAYVAQVRAAIDRHGLTDRVEITGPLTRKQAFRGVDLGLLPSRLEAYGLVVTEALARGIPSIVSAGGPEEALGRTSTGVVPGVVVPPRDPVAFADALRRWLTDPEHRADVRAAALARRETLDGWDQAARALVAGLTTIPGIAP
jgi:hypothetical protein